MKWTCLIALAAGTSACSVQQTKSSAGSQTGEGTKPRTHQVDVNPDGSFSPEHLLIRDGDTVEWRFSSATDTIIPIADGAKDPCSAALPYAPQDANAFLGPLTRGRSGIFSLGPDDLGFETETCNAGACADGSAPTAAAGNECLCTGSQYYATADATWQNPELTGVFIRIDWKRVQLAPGDGASSFDFSALDRELDQAVSHGKVFSLGFRAGKAGTPDWLFSTDPDGTPRPKGGGGVQRVHLRDKGSDDEGTGCGFTMDLGSPADPQYRKHYFGLLKAVADHIKSRGDWYRALAYIKLSGANLLTFENRLPKRCDPGCLCNTQAWADAGYTPSGLYEFYAQQTSVLLEAFPDKDLSYALIQDGFPKVNDAGDYELPDGSSSGGLGSLLPSGVEQTEQILKAGPPTAGLAFAVQHNGLHPLPSAPNKWAVKAGEQGQLTGFQTSNATKVGSLPELESALENSWSNSDAVFCEVYEQMAWRAVHAPGRVLDSSASGRTLGQWADAFHSRRRSAFPELGEPYPLLHAHTFKRPSGASGVLRFSYMNGTKCLPDAHVGVIEIEEVQP
ncbi:MAG: hypothetical protein R3B13_10610 [Polyangiaceae bacterium]